MNYGEELAYWYFRLNGFFPITNFVIHRSSEVRDTSDCDLLAIRPPSVYEEIGGKPDDWDSDLAAQLGFDHLIGVICEVKTGRYRQEEIFRPEYVKYSVNRLGLVPREEISEFTRELIGKACLETKAGNRICKILIANDYKESGGFFFRNIGSAEDFIIARVQKYSDVKYADRMYFGSELLQYTIHRIHREKKGQTL